MTDTIVEARNLSKHYKDHNALDQVNLRLSANRIYGLLGRNGAGKTTLMSILTAQAFATAGEALVFGSPAYENEAVLSRICFIRESQKYPDDFQPRHAFRSAALFYKDWDQQFAEQLAEEFQLPTKRRIKKLSRGQLSAVGVIIGLASRAELTFFDEPYLGLDAVARQLFYDHLVKDFAEHPRTIILSSHLIDEVANLLEHVVVIDKGRIIMDADADALRGSAVTVSGSADTVDSFLAGRTILHREVLGSLASVTLDGALDGRERAEALELGLDLSPVSLQQLVVRKTMAAGSPLLMGNTLDADAAVEVRR
ncbi:ABC transporter ATP-binding protein [Paenarthrobacter ilicis]|uniref:ABC-2 type transport system ATP-binding protein n=1 Tax=Paenarthrobacter ilicis TaxID=43665 RepID=A0ABX0TGE0_9MICC|nr:ABC transporter ATP-binding protein [Paenarthrobacter ilicis]MBM7793641.1 ABC-2 type transport system ATP-binding protein [Paenarthrobacter ilicis]NII99821.1 ABC-2 type transport system ATP-binding protein [Paenarthrobacter ilicis]